MSKQLQLTPTVWSGSGSSPFLQDDKSPQHVSKSDLSHFSKNANFSHLEQGYCSFLFFCVGHGSYLSLRLRLSDLEELTILVAASLQLYTIKVMV